MRIGARFSVPAAACAALALAGYLFGADPSPVGAWRTVDDKTGKPRSIVRIYDEGGKLFGKVESGLNPETAARTCDQCKDERKGKPIVGMVIMRNLKAHGDEFDGGDILDPDNGSVYRCKIKVTEGGAKLQVRGFIGISLLGRTQTWIREPQK
jgi:uncharacterized protein (DUF2147 family)